MDWLRSRSAMASASACPRWNIAAASAVPSTGTEVPGPSLPLPLSSSSVKPGRTPPGSKEKLFSPSSTARASSPACRDSSSAVRNGGPAAFHACARPPSFSHTSPEHSSEPSAEPWPRALLRSRSAGSFSSKPKPGSSGGSTRRVKGSGGASFWTLPGPPSRRSDSFSPLASEAGSPRGAAWEMSARKPSAQAGPPRTAPPAPPARAASACRAGRARLATDSSTSVPARRSTSSRLASGSDTCASRRFPERSAATAPTREGTTSARGSSTAPASRFTP